MTLRAKVIVAPRRKLCRVCTLPPAGIATVNSVIWRDPGNPIRAHDYRIAGVAACDAQGLRIEEKSITRHAEHIERTWRRATDRRPAAPGEIAVFATDYEAMVEKAAALGAQAMAELVERIPQMDDRDLVAAAKVGMAAVTQRQAIRLKAQQVSNTDAIMEALFGLSSGHVDPADLPEAEVVDVTPVEVLLDEVAKERASLKRLQAGEAVPA